MDINKIYCLVLGGHVNGYSIIQELYDNDIRNIALFDYGNSYARKSNKVSYLDIISRTKESLFNKILKLKQECDYIVIYPTDDVQLELLQAINIKIQNFCFLPFNTENLIESLDKYYQYTYSEKCGVPYPKTKNIKNQEELSIIETMFFPVLVKPNKRDDLTSDIFRNLYLESLNDFYEKKTLLQDKLKQGHTFIVSEFIPGDDTNIYAYVGYRNKSGTILNEWIGKKLNQYPDKFGVFSSATNKAPDIIRIQGRKLLDIMNLYGIAEPEFKYDSRDGQYKLMEINLRSMMWHRVGSLSKVNIQYTQYLDATGNISKIKKQEQGLEKSIHYIFLKHEIINLIFRKKYWKNFKSNIFKGEVNYLAVFDKNDLKPFLFSLYDTFKTIIKRCLKQ